MARATLFLNFVRRCQSQSAGVILPSESPVPLLPELVIKSAELAEESNVGPTLPRLPHDRQRLRGREVLLGHQVGSHNGRGAGVAQQAANIDWKRKNI